MTKEATTLARRLGYPHSWIAGQIAVELVPDFRPAWPRQAEAWAAIRAVRTRSVPPDVAAVEVALHGDRGHFTRRLPDALVRLAGLDELVAGHEAAEQAAAALMDETRPAATPFAGMVRRVMDHNQGRPPMAGSFDRLDPIAEGGDDEPTDLHAIATTMVGMEDAWEGGYRRFGAFGTEEAMRFFEGMLGREAVDAEGGPADPGEWSRFVGELDHRFEGLPWAAVCALLVRGARPEVLVAAVRMAGQFPFGSIGIDSRGRRARAGAVAAITPNCLFLWAATAVGRQFRENSTGLSSLPTTER